MKIRLEKYNKSKTYMSPSSVIMTPEVVAKEYPATQAFTHVIETDASGEMMYAINSLASLRGMYDIDPALSEDAAIAALEVIRNTPPPEAEPSAEERIAAAMEFQNMMSL